jgi:hypothetical protein
MASCWNLAQRRYPNAPPTIKQLSLEQLFNNLAHRKPHPLDDHRTTIDTPPGFPRTTPLAQFLLAVQPLVPHP